MSAAMARTNETQDRRLSIAGLIVAAVFFVAINAFAAGAFRGWSIDFTEAGLFTLSDSTRQVLSEIEEPVTLRFFYSPSIAESAPGIAAYADRVRQMLERYDEIAGPGIDLEVYNPEPFSDAEDLAVGFGLQGVPLDDEGTADVFFGLAGTNSTDDEETIPFFHPQREAFLEYDLTRLISTLANPRERVIYLSSSLPISGRQGSPIMNQGGVPPWQIMSQINEGYEVRPLEESAERAPDDADVIVLVHPQDLSDRERYLVDQWVLSGGRLIVFADPHAEALQQQAMQRPGLTGSNLPDLFEAWGVTMDDAHVVGDANAAIRVQVSQGGRQQVADYLAWLGLEGDLITQDPLTADAERINMATVGHLAPVEGAQTEITPLLRSSAEAGLIPVEEVAFMADPTRLWQDFAPTGERYTLAARITGPARTAFPDGPPPPAEEDEGEEGAGQPGPASAEDGDGEADGADGAAGDGAQTPEQLTQGDITVIVVADTDLLRDQFWVQRQEFFGRSFTTESAANGDFVMNAIDSFTGNAALVGLRGRDTAQRPFTLVRALEREAEAEYRATEQELRTKLEATQQNLRELQTDVGEDGGVILTDEQKAAIDNFTAEVLEIRRQLRDVQGALREDIETLEGWLKFINIALIPILIALIAIALAMWQRRRRSRARVMDQG